MTTKREWPMATRESMETELQQARETNTRLNRRCSILEGAVRQMWDACRADGVRLSRRHDVAYGVVMEMEKALAARPATGGEALEAGEVIDVAGRNLRVCAMADGVTLCRDHRKRVAVRNVATNRLSYVPEQRLLNAKRMRNTD